LFTLSTVTWWGSPGAQRASSRHVVERLGPRNHFRLEPSASYVFIAGGIGITPILPMIARAEAEGAEWTLLYGGRTASSMAFTGELAGYGEKVTLHPQDTLGLLDLDTLLGTPRPGTLVYCCGPEPLLLAVEERMAAWSDDSLHVERFAVPEPPARDAADEHAVEVVLAESGITVSVAPDTSILQALLDAGVDVEHDCTEGICGTCETKVLEGEVDHRDYVLTAREKAAGDCMMVCVSRACGKRLVLGL
jgi:ferredoxin-NADP reductase